MGKKLQLLSFAIANVAIALLAVAVVTNHWATRETSKLHVYEGLFKKCIYYKIKDYERCIRKYEGDLPPEKLLVTMVALVATAFFHCFIFVLSLFLMCNRLKYYRKTEITLSIFEFLALMTALGSVIVYTISYDSNYYRLQWSYAICWAGVMSYFASLILTIIHIDLAGKKVNRQHVRYSSHDYWRNNSRTSYG